MIGYTQIDANLAAVPGAEILAARGVRTTAAGLQFEANWGGGQASLHPRMVARFNVSNLLAVLAALLQRGVSLEEAATVAARMTPPEGRMQLVGGIGGTSGDHRLRAYARCPGAGARGCAGQCRDPQGQADLRLRLRRRP